MKKIVVFLLLGFAAFIMLAGNSSYAADDVVDIYPYDQPGCLTTSDSCLGTRVGGDNWNFTYGGYRYHAVRGSVRYVSDFEDDNNDGNLTALELTGISWSSFGSTIINNTDETAVLKVDDGDKNRMDLYSSARHDVYLHFDDDGVLQMFENSVNEYYIHNDGTTEAPEWRLATQTEIDAYDAAETPAEDTPNTILDNIRMKLDDTDTKGYVLERLNFVELIKAGVDTTTEPESAWSDVIDGNPVDITLPSGWTVMTFAYLDRTSNAKNLDFIMDLPGIMLDDTVDPMVPEYVHQPATFTGLTDLDDDAVTPGVNIVVEYNGEFDLDPTVSSAWLNMFDETGEIINSVENLDYSVAISKDDTLLETIDFTYDSEEDEYTASADVTVIDTSVFGAGYKAVWSTTTPEGDDTMVEVDIVIGVMPPRFAGVEDRFINQSTVVDLLENITADDGYGNDVTPTIEVSYPADLNPYNPFPGEYEIDLEFTHNVFIPGIQTAVTINGEVIDLDPELDVNVDVATTVHAAPMVFTDEEIFQEIGSGWGSVLVKVAADGTMMERYDRYNWEFTDSTGTTVGSLELFEAWQADMTLADGEFMVTAHGSVEAPRLRAANLSFGDPVTFEPGTDDFSYDIVTESSYMLTVDDMTAPIAMVINDAYVIYAGEYGVNNAILGNVVAYDFTDAQEDLVIYVSNNGGLNTSVPGTYSVEVTVEDEAGHTDVVPFDIIVLEAVATQEDIDNAIEAAIADEIQALIDANVLTQEDIETLIEDNMLSEAAIQALIDAKIEEIPETGCGSSINGTSAIFITFSLVLGAAAIFFIRKRS